MKTNFKRFTRKYRVYIIGFQFVVLLFIVVLAASNLDRTTDEILTWSIPLIAGVLLKSLIESISSLRLTDRNDSHRPTVGKLSFPAPRISTGRIRYPGSEQLEDSIKRPADELRQELLGSVQSGDVKHIAVLGQASNGKRSIVWRIHEGLLEDPVQFVAPKDVLFFDCSSIPHMHLHDHFLWSVGAHFDAVEIATDQTNVVEEDIYPTEYFTQPVPDWLAPLRQGMARRHGRAIVLIAEVQRLFDDFEADLHDDLATEKKEKTQQVLDLLIRQKDMPILFSATSESWSAIKESLTSRNQRRIAEFDIEQHDESMRCRIEALAKMDAPRSRLNGLGFNSLKLLGALLNRLDQSATAEFMAALELVSPELQNSALINECIAECAHLVEKDLGIEEETDKHIFHNLLTQAIVSQSFFEWPLTGRELKKVWRKIPDRPNHHPSESRLFNSMRKALLDLELLVDLRSPNARQLPYYVQPPIVRDFGRSHARQKSSAVGRLQYALLRYKELRTVLARDFEPQLPTAFSRHLSGTKFRWIGDLVGLFRQSDGVESCVIPLDSDSASLVFPGWSDGSTHDCRLVSYVWRKRSGDEQREVAFLLSELKPPWDRVWHVNVHIDSRQGSGSSVLRAIEQIGSIEYVEGDANRCGPGGVINAIVKVSDALSNPSDAEIMLQSALQTSKDSQTVVSITPFMEHELAGELNDALIAHTAKVTAQIQWNGYGAGESVPALVLKGETLKDLKEYLSGQGVARGSDIASYINLQCYVSMITRQAFLIVGQKSEEEVVSVYLWSDLTHSRGSRLRGTIIARHFMDLAAEMDINLQALRPLGEYGCRADFPVEAEEVEGVCQVLINAIETEEKLAGVKVALLGRSDATQAGEKLAENAVARIQPEVYHRIMRRHLFLTEADSSIVTLAGHEMIRRSNNSDEMRALEIGSGTGALTEKILASGISNIDVLEPDKKLIEFWKNQIQPRSFAGQNVNMCIEEFAKEFPESKYDLVIAQGVYHHFMPASGCDKAWQWTALDEHRLNSLECCARLLNAGGLMLVSDEFLLDYRDSLERIKFLDRWYECVIAKALSDRLPELAQMEQSFWNSDRSGSGEFKVSREVFECQIARVEGQPFSIECRIDFGFTEECPGGFSIYALRRN